MFYLLRLFGKSLDKLVVNGEMPTVLKVSICVDGRCSLTHAAFTVCVSILSLLQSILVRLYTEGPSCHGVFRKSANYAKKQELRAAIDRGKQEVLIFCMTVIKTLL